MDKALELADVMEKYSVAGFQYPLCDEFKQAATMLRQQQAEIDECKYSIERRNSVLKKNEAEIEALKAEIVSIKKNTDYWADKNNWIKNNEPVAELVLEQMAVGDASSLRVHWLTDGCPPVGTKLYTHPVKELHLSLQKDKQTGELLAVTYTDDEHRIVEVLWQRPPEAQLMLTHEEINDAWKQSHEDGVAMQQGFTTQQHYFAHLILRKAQEK